MPWRRKMVDIKTFRGRKLIDHITMNIYEFYEGTLPFLDSETYIVENEITHINGEINESDYKISFVNRYEKGRLVSSKNFDGEKNLVQLVIMKYTIDNVLSSKLTLMPKNNSCKFQWNLYHTDNNILRNVALYARINEQQQLNKVDDIKPEYSENYIKISGLIPFCDITKGLINLSLELFIENQMIANVIITPETL